MALGLQFTQACFAAGTPIRTPDGAVVIEQIKPGDPVLSRSEFDPHGPVAAKVVEQVFVRSAPVLDLHVGGRTITTTAEHPFFAEGQGWVPVRELNCGSRVLGLDGEWLLVDGVDDNGLVATVYNFRIANWHTYFVGTEEWGFSVWAHNICLGLADEATAEQGNLFAARAAELWGRLPEPARYGATVGVTQTAEGEFIALYANLGNGERQFTYGQLTDALSALRTENPDSVVIWVTGQEHAEMALFNVAPEAPAIGVSNIYGPCPEICGNYFSQPAIDYYNFYWPGEIPGRWGD